MIIKDIRKEFFDALKGRILIMCALDVDAICACKILQFLLESHNLQYSVAPVASIDNLWKSFEEYRNSVDTIIFINFGNLINIPKLLKPAENLIFYVIDSHRPINVHNYYKNPQVKLYINKHEETLNIPPEHKIFLKRNGSEHGADDDEDEAAELELLTAEARNLTTKQLEERRELRRKIMKKQKLLFEYEEFHFYNRSVALIMYDLANFLAKNNNYLLWLGIIGVTYQLKSDKIDSSMFEHEAEKIIRYKSRNQVSNNHARGSKWRIEWEVDLQLELYRRWTVFDSLCHSPLTMCKFKLWNDKGISDLHEFMVTCGLKTSATKQQYAAMDMEFRKGLTTSVSDICLGDLRHKYNLENLVTRAFVVYAGFKKCFCANDFVLGVRALLESHDPNTKMTEKFVRAIQSLSYEDVDFSSLSEGFLKAQTQLKSMFVQVKYLVTNLKVLDAGAFLHVDLSDQGTRSCDFARGESIMAFSRFLLTAYVESKTTRLARRAVRLPLVLFSPDYHNEEEIIIVGIPPIAQQVKKNFFAKAFEQAASNIGCEIKADLSETNLVRTNVHNKIPMFEQLKLLLEG
jgi:cell division control protein 45